MPVPISGDNFSPHYAVVADTRRRWSEAEKQAIIGEALQAGVNASLLFRWRKLAQGEAKTAAPAFLPISLTAPAKSVDTSCDPSASEAPARDSRIEIELANGRRVRVGPGADMNALKRILDIVDGRQRP
jgi:transposase